MRGLSDAWIIDLEPIKFAIRGALLAGNWEVDQVVVVRRIKVEKGFAAVSREAGVAFEVKAVGKATCRAGRPGGHGIRIHRRTRQ